MFPENQKAFRIMYGLELKEKSAAHSINRIEIGH